MTKNVILQLSLSLFLSSPPFSVQHFLFLLPSKRCCCWRSRCHLKFSTKGYTQNHRNHKRISRKGEFFLGPGCAPSLTCWFGLGLLLHKPKAHSPQSRPRARKPGQAFKSPSSQHKARAWPEPAFYRPDPAPIFPAKKVVGWVEQ
jgi:hypothetical protein